MPNTDITISLQRVRSSDIDEVQAFHLSQLTEFIWPRTCAELTALVESESLLAAFANITGTSEKYIVGMCYVIRGEDFGRLNHWEFGGLCVRDDFRGYGIGMALGRVAISSHYLYDSSRTDNRLIAHIHEGNFSPHPLSEKETRQIETLGFTPAGREIITGNIVPDTMRRNRDGNLAAYLYEFQISSLSRFADWLESFKNVFTGRNGTYRGELNIPVFKGKYLPFAIEDLRAMSKQKPAAR